MPRKSGYEILQALAEGAGEGVYHALQKTLRREVAIKVLSAVTFDREEAWPRFLQEALSLKRPAPAEANGQAYLAVIHEELPLEEEPVQVVLTASLDGESWRRVAGKAALVYHTRELVLAVSKEQAFVAALSTVKGILGFSFNV